MKAIIHEQGNGFPSEDWHRGYPAPAILRAIGHALDEAIYYDRCAGMGRVRVEWLDASLAAVRERAEGLAPDAYDGVVEIASGLFFAGRSLFGYPFGSVRLVCLLEDLSRRSGDWIVALKRRKEWLGSDPRGAPE